MFGAGISGITNLIEYARRRGHLGQISIAARNHGGQNCACCIDMGHDMQLPTGLPCAVGGRGCMIRLPPENTRV